MNSRTIELLEFNKIKERLMDFAISDIAKEMLEKLQIEYDANTIEKNLLETTEARNIVNISSSIPIHSLKGIRNVQSKMNIGSILMPDELELVASLLKDGYRLKNFMEDKTYAAPNISQYALSLYELSEISSEIERCILNGAVADKASSALAKIRKKIFILEDRIKSKLDSILRNDNYKVYLQDSLVSQRNGRYVIPVKSEYKRSIEGDIQDRSSSGSTVFIEPADVKKAQDELNLLRIDEEKEVYKVLSTLTALVDNAKRELNINIETMAYYDFIFAKGKFSKAIDGSTVIVNTNNYINIINGRHPLIGFGAVPLNFITGKDYRAVVITGPNTGGKTVVLKTVGLLTLMVQSGLHVPVEENSEFAIFADILVDIGDGQSIEQSLSTFSSHIKNIIDILNKADKYSLVIIDEIGSGTDPKEGSGLAAAVLRKLYDKGATILATTHYSDIKDFANENEGFVNGCMEFDINTLKPVYKLNIGKMGESNAFLIALRLGMDSKLIEEAHKITYSEEKDYSHYKFEEKQEITKPTEDLKLHKENIQKLKDAIDKPAAKKKQEPLFNIGDCVFISFMNRTGIICELENGKGEYGVMVMKKKLKVNKKRLSLYVDNKELYPEDYDFDVVFKSVDTRKKQKLMGKRHVDGNTIILDEGDK